MDGNRRWAKLNSVKSLVGHEKGVLNDVKLLSSINNNKKFNISIITLYVFSQDNWNRPVSEVLDLFKLIENIYLKFEGMADEENFKINHFGSLKKIPKSIKELINKVVIKTSKNNGLVVNLAFNYSSKDELIYAIKKLKGKKINAKLLESNLFTSKIPDPDLIIRTGGEMRLSNFMLWQSAYSELYFTKILWPNFNFYNFKKAVDNYIKRSRNYGT